MIIISEEAEILIPLIRSLKSPSVHLIAYSTPVTKHMLKFSRLSYYALPPLPKGHAVPDWLAIEIGIFSGRLYFDYHEATSIKEYLGLGDAVDATNINGLDRFTANPAGFLQEWLPLRRKGQDIMHTPIAYICQGRLLRADHAFFVVRRSRSQEGASQGKHTGTNDDVEIDDCYEDEDEWNMVNGT